MCGRSIAESSVNSVLRLEKTSPAAVITDAGIDISENEPSSRALRAAADAVGGFDPTGGALHYQNSEYDGKIALAADSWFFY